MYTIMAAVAFIIPGSIVISITRRVIPKKENEYNTKILEYFIYSFLNFFMWSILIYNIYSNINSWKEHYVLLWLTLFMIIFLAQRTASFCLSFSPAPIEPVWTYSFRLQIMGEFSL